MIVPYSPSGNADIMARLVAQRLGENLGQQVVVDNRPGANGIIGTGLAVKAAPDGYTIVLVASSLATNPSLVKSMPYDTQRDLAAISMVGSTPLIIAAFAGLPVVTIKDLIALAKTKPGLINYASSGHGSPANMAGELFKFMTGTNIVHVAYKGTAQATTDALGGQVELHAPSLAGGMPLVRGGKLRPLGVAAARRSAGAPDIPAIAETLPGYDAAAWYGLVGPAGLPKPVVQRLNEEMQSVLADPAVLASLRTAGVDIEAGSPEAMRLVMADPVRSGIDLMDRIGFRPQ